jgi:hypothetical protein
VHFQAKAAIEKYINKLNIRMDTDAHILMNELEELAGGVGKGPQQPIGNDVTFNEIKNYCRVFATLKRWLRITRDDRLTPRKFAHPTEERGRRYWLAEMSWHEG